MRLSVTRTESKTRASCSSVSPRCLAARIRPTRTLCGTRMKRLLRGGRRCICGANHAPGSARQARRRFLPVPARRRGHQAAAIPSEPRRRGSAPPAARSEWFRPLRAQHIWPYPASAAKGRPSGRCDLSRRSALQSGWSMPSVWRRSGFHD
jgi:hypothetical protein